MQESREGVPQSYYGEAPPPSYYEAPPPIPAVRAVDLNVGSYEREVPTHGYAQPSAPAYAQPAARSVLTEETRSFQTELGCVGGILIASVVELAEASIICDDDPWSECEDKDAWAVAVGVISLVMCLFYCALCYYKVAAIKVYSKYLSIFLMLWWGVGTATLTFDSDFMYTGNGYFACWGAAFLSMYYCQITVLRSKMLGERITQVIVGDRQNKVIMLILLFSIGEAAAAVLLWDEYSCYWCRNDKITSQETWAFCAGFISGSVAALYMLKRICVPSFSEQSVFVKHFSWFLVPWWLSGVGVVTFNEPFPNTGNGYFFAWGAFLCSCYLVFLTTVITREASV